jgi:hypothetical protein
VTQSAKDNVWDQVRNTAIRKKYSMHACGFASAPNTNVEAEEVHRPNAQDCHETSGPQSKGPQMFPPQIWCTSEEHDDAKRTDSGL